MKTIILFDGPSTSGKSTHAQKLTAYLSKVKIYKKYRRNGYCCYLIKKAINRAKIMKIKKIYLHVKNTNISAIKCYKKNKFKITRKNYDNNKLFGYTMTLLLR